MVLGQLHLLFVVVSQPGWRPVRPLLIVRELRGATAFGEGEFLLFFYCLFRQLVIHIVTVLVIEALSE